MAIRFHLLPLEAFPEEARPAIARLNRELQELAVLEGVLKNAISARRSDASIVRNQGFAVEASRVEGLSVGAAAGGGAVGTPELVFGTVNVVGTTTTAISINSQIALFSAATPEGVSLTGAAGTSTFAARVDHRHAHQVFATGDLHTDLLHLSGVRPMVGTLTINCSTHSTNLALNQNGGVGSSGSHIAFSSRADTPSGVTAGDFWRSADILRFNQSDGRNYNVGWNPYSKLFSGVAA